MFKVVIIALLLLFTSSLQTTTRFLNSPVKDPLLQHQDKKFCVQKCMEKIKDVRVQRCKKAYVLGGLVRRCSIKKIKGLCNFKCKSGKKLCFTKCRTNCACKKIKSCKKVCFRGKDCRKACCWKYQKKCFLSRLSEQFIDKCRFILKQNPFKKCLETCSKPLKNSCPPCRALCIRGDKCICGICVKTGSCPPCRMLCIRGKRCICGKCV